MDDTNTTAGGAGRPWHLWLIAITSLVWNGFGAFDYSATMFQWEPYMANFTEAQRAYFYSLPSWQVAGWALGVWTALLGSLALLFRHRIAVWMFALSLLGMFVGLINYVISEQAQQVMSGEYAIFSAVIVLIGVGLLMYARAMTRGGVLR